MTIKTEINGKIYWQDAKGALVAEELIKDIDKTRDELISELIQSASALQHQIRTFKHNVFNRHRRVCRTLRRKIQRQHRRT
ncbi:hypothetical protein HNR69_001263 [Histophilus somni]|nr:hypothetical protein [Histophilus somni]